MTQTNNYAYEFRKLCADDVMASGTLADFDKNINIIVEKVRLEERKKVVEEIKKLGVNTPEQLRTLNEGLPSTVQEQEYLKGLGYWKCLDNVIELINKIK